MKYPIIFAFFLSLVIVSNCFSKYKVSAFMNSSTIYTIQLKYSGTEDYYIKPTSPIIKDLTFVFHTYAYNDFSIKIYDPNNHRF